MPKKKEKPLTANVLPMRFQKNYRPRSLEDITRHFNNDPMVNIRPSKFEALTKLSNSLIGNLGGSELIRTEFLRFLLDGPRDIDAECGYAAWLTPDHYKAMYDREGAAQRVVECWPDETWAEDPDIFEDPDPEIKTKFETAWQGFVSKYDAYHYLHRSDVLSGIGQFGILLIGLDDGKDLREPIDGVNDDGTFADDIELDVTYLRPFSEEVTFVKIRETDVNNPRYGQPKMYYIQFRDFPNWGIQAGEIIARDVHWSRVIHLADNRKVSEIYGIPRMQQVWNRLYDLRKVYASSGEAFWKGAFPGIAFEVNPEVADQGIEIDKKALREEMGRFQRGTERYFAVTGITAKQMPPMIVDPSKTVETLLKAIAIAKGIPFRILFGSEEAKLASNEDARAWNKRVKRRREKYVNPMIIRPFIDRLISLGVLPMPKDGYQIDWPDLNSPTDKDKADIGLIKSQSMQAYVSSGANQLMSPKDFLTIILGLSNEEADIVMQNAMEANGDVDDGFGEESDNALPPPNDEQVGDTPDNMTEEGGLAGANPDNGTIFDDRNISRRSTVGKGKSVESTFVQMPDLNSADVREKIAAYVLVANTIIKKSDGYYVESEHKPRKNLGGPYKSRAAAVKRLQQVEYFKRNMAQKLKDHEGKTSAGNGENSNNGNMGGADEETEPLMAGGRLSGDGGEKRGWPLDPNTPGKSNGKKHKTR